MPVMHRKIDIFNHVMPARYLELVKTHSKEPGIVRRMSSLRMLWDIEARVAMLRESFPDVRQVLTLSLPPPELLGGVFAPGAPVVTVHDAATHAMAWLGSALGVPAVPLGVDAFGQSGSVADLYRVHDLLPGSIVNAALTALHLGS